MKENNIAINNELPPPAARHEITELSVRADEIQEIISRKPGFLEKWALWLFALILLLLFGGTWLIQYPDVVYASATLTAANAPKEIVTRQDGKLVALFTANDDKVTEGQIIAWIESTANHKEVLALNALLDTSITLLSTNETNQVSNIFKTPFEHLGELQPGYQQFITALQQFNDYLVTGYYYKKMQVLLQDLNFLQKMHDAIAEQKKLTQQDLELTQEGFNANNTLYNEKVISKQDYRDQKAKLLNKQLSIPQMQSSLLTNENAQTAKQKEISELEHTISQQKTIFQQALQTLKSQTDEWKRKYIITAPVNGKVVFIVPLQQNQFLSAGKIIGYINPTDSRYYAQIVLPQNNFGKIDTGQKVQLRFDAYPYQEFGYVGGMLNYISKVPGDSGFLATVQLPGGLLTNYKKQVQYRSGLKCQALIITKNTRLLQRFYYNVAKSTQQ